MGGIVGDGDETVLVMVMQHLDQGLSSCVSDLARAPVNVADVADVVDNVLNSNMGNPEIWVCPFSLCSMYLGNSYLRNDVGPS